MSDYTLTPTQVAALTALHNAPDAHLRPCLTNPEAWDRSEAPNRSPRRYDAPVHACLTACPVLDLCRAYRATGVRVDGVLAGVAPVAKSGRPAHGGAA